MLLTDEAIIFIENSTNSRSYLDHARAIESAVLAKLREQEPVYWTHSCNVLCLDNVELWIDRCPHCGKPSPFGVNK